MGMIFLLTVAASALCPASSRQYHFVYERKTLEDARSYCRQRYADLATVESMDDVHTLNNMADMSRLLNPDGSHYRAWIGLYDDVTSWAWSLADPAYYSEGQTNYRNWVLGEPANQGANQFCVYMDHNGFWMDEHCVNQHAAICVDRTGGSENYVLTTATFSWEGAQQHCRQHYTDLASVRDAEENQQLHALIPSSRAWIGLKRGPWRWLDGNNSTFSYWKTQGLVEPNNLSQYEYCVAAHFEFAGTWEDWNCDHQRAFICYSWPVKKFRIKLQLQTDSADPNDPATREDILKQLQRNIMKTNATELLNLSWAEDADGKVFQKVDPIFKEETCADI